VRVRWERGECGFYTLGDLTVEHVAHPKEVGTTPTRSEEVAVTKTAVFFYLKKHEIKAAQLHRIAYHAATPR